MAKTSKRRLKGGWKGFIDHKIVSGPQAGSSDMMRIWKEFIFRDEKARDLIFDPIPIDPKTKHLFVVDMQNDFIDRPYKETVASVKDSTGKTIFIEDPPGCNPANITGLKRHTGLFGVTQGSSIVEPMQEYIKTCYESGYKNIVFSRDFHSVDHCSFCQQKGTYPAHCIHNTTGAEIIKEIKTIQLSTRPITDPVHEFLSGHTKIHMVFKGFHPLVDSFQGFASCDSKKKFRANAKISGPTCKNNLAEGGCGNAMGGYKLRKGYKGNWDRDITDATNNIVESKDLAVGIAFENKPFEIPNVKKGDVIEVCGLAGDYCVRNTANALAEKYKGIATVVVLLDLIRYPVLPSFDYVINKSLEDGERFNTELPLKIESQEDKDTKKKGINSYLIKWTIGTPNKYVFLKPDEVLEYEFKTLSPDTRIGNYVKSTGEPLAGNEVIVHFLTNEKDIIDDYTEYGVKIYGPLPKEETVIKTDIEIQNDKVEKSRLAAENRMGTTTEWKGMFRGGRRTRKKKLNKRRVSYKRV